MVEIANEPQFGRKAPPGKVFIYVLLFNVPGLPQWPYYVGQAMNLTARFNNHQQVVWHLAKFQQLPRIWVAGMVPAALADQAEQDLIARTIRAGYELTNTRIENRNARRQNKASTLAMIDRDHIGRYLTGRKSSPTVLTSWAEKWTKAEAGTGNGITRADIEAYMESLEYHSPEARALSLAVAERYDIAKDVAEFIPHETLTGRLSTTKINAHVKHVRHLWRVKGHIMPTQLTAFRLHKKQKQAIAARMGDRS